MPEIAFDRYYRYDELTEILRAFEREYPELVAVESIGKSHEGRDIWLVTATDKSTGPHDEKPAFFCDGNIHATEVSGSSAVLMVLNKLIRDKRELLASRTFYLIPRLNPDGAEWALETPPRVIRSSTRPYPYDEEDFYGLELKDLNGDGKILNVRIKDPNGPWKVCEDEPRLLVRREPGESGGTYYRVVPEGLFHNWDGMGIRVRRRKEGLDMNRNYPSAWRQEHEQHGAGPYPTSEPEVHAEVDAICKRPNICGGIAFHTFAGVILRPPGRYSDDDLPPEDLWTYKTLGKHGTEMTGYPTIGIFQGFKYHPKEIMTGDFDDWLLEHRGAYSFTVEIWSPQRQAGITEYDVIDWYRDHPVEHDKLMLKWSDEKLGGKGYVDWAPFNHPQLGEVELGGWDGQLAFRNPPAEFLEAEVGPLAEWAIWLAGLSPKLEKRELRVEPQGDGVWRLRYAVHNTGWLPTNVTKLAVDHKLCRGVVGEIARQGDEPGGAGAQEPAWLLSGKLREKGPQLVGWNHVPCGGFGWHLDGTDDVAVFEWVVRGAGTYELTAKHDRAGVVREKLELA